VFSLDGSMVASENLSFDGFYTYEDKKARLDSLAIARGTTTNLLEPHTGCNPYPTVVTNPATLPSDYYTDPCRQWSETQSDRVHTFGIGFKALEVGSPRFSLNGNLVYSQARTPISVNGGTYYSNGLPVMNNIYIPAQNLPDVTTTMFNVRLVGTWAIDKASAVRIGYEYGYLKSSDWQYDAYTNSPLGVIATQAYTGSGLTAPRYNVNVLGLSYLYRFQ
jgi:hypothetical protein